MPLFGELLIRNADLAKKFSAAPDLTWLSLKRILYTHCCRDVVCCHKTGLPPEADVQEWLLDFVWLDRDTLAMKLGVECEWSKIEPQIKDDFEKLMSVKAPLKLFIYATDKVANERVHEWLREWMGKFSQHIEGEEYLLMEVKGKQANFY